MRFYDLDSIQATIEKIPRPNLMPGCYDKDSIEGRVYHRSTTRIKAARQTATQKLRTGKIMTLECLNKGCPKAASKKDNKYWIISKKQRITLALALA